MVKPEYARVLPSLVDARFVEAVLARQNPDHLVYSVILDTHCARGAVGGTLMQI